MWLEEVEDKTKLIEREQHWIDFYKSSDREFGYNLSPTAGSCLGVTHTDEVKAAQSVRKKGRARTPEEKAAIKAGWLQRKARGPVSEETKRRSSESHKGKTHSAEWKAAMSKRVTGTSFAAGSKRSPEHIAAMHEGKRLAKRRREKDLMWTWVK